MRATPTPHRALHRTKLYPRCAGRYRRPPLSGTMVDSMETLAAALDLCPDGTPVDFLFRVPEDLGGRRRGRGRNEEIARFQHRGESGGIF